jgi:hypothetical protein
VFFVVQGYYSFVVGGDDDVTTAIMIPFRIFWHSSLAFELFFLLMIFTSILLLLLLIFLRLLMFGAQAAQSKARKAVDLEEKKRSGL